MLPATPFNRDPKMAAFLIVRAQVDPAAKRRVRHLVPERAPAAGGRRLRCAVGASRGWSELEENVHIAFYEFRDMPDVNRVMASDALKRMIGEFDRLWSGQVTRTREVVELVQSI